MAVGRAMQWKRGIHQQIVIDGSKTALYAYEKADINQYRSMFSAFTQCCLFSHEYAGHCVVYLFAGPRKINGRFMSCTADVQN